MSFKLKIVSVTSLLMLAIIFIAQNKESTREPASAMWSKAGAPVAVRIIEQDYSSGTVTLEAQVKSSISELDTEWVLPEGVEIVSGHARDHMSFESLEDIQSQTVTLKISTYIGAKHVSFQAYIMQEGERLGATMAYSLVDADSDERKKLEEIRAHMKARGDNPLQ